MTANPAIDPELADAASDEAPAEERPGAACVAGERQNSVDALAGASDGAHAEERPHAACVAGERQSSVNALASASDGAPAEERPHAACVAGERQKMRVRFSKLGKVRFTSHRDVARIWERALRKAAVPVAYSEGFSPRPKLSFGLALPTGAESLGEYLDVDVEHEIDPASFPARLDPCLPVGFHVQGAVEIEPGTPSLQQAVVSCTWHIEVGGLTPAVLGERIASVVGADELVVTRERKGRMVTDDLRPAILNLALESPGTVMADLATTGRGLRPSELVALLGDDVHVGRVCRIHQWTMSDGALAEPLIPGELAALATSALRAEVRAS